jgi:alkylated DNA repair dioxygenase AlkB
LSPKSTHSDSSLLAPELSYLPSFIAADQCAGALRLLEESLHWEQSTIRLFGKLHLIPRLNAFHGDEGFSYTYSGAPFITKPWTPLLVSIKDQIQQLLHIPCNSVLANWYRDGRDSMGWHADDEPELGLAPVIVTISFGAPRVLRFRHRLRQKPSFGVLLEPGSALVMGAGLQSQWQHCLPKRAASGPRISLTYRQLLTSPSHNTII